jgi:mannose-6-phosphate isomerase-like protein (cupin superfamily)
MSESGVGRWYHNPATGELARTVIDPADNGGQLAEAELWLQPGAAVARAHVHAHFTERFEVLDGSVGFVIDGVERVVGGGEGELEIPVGVVHDWFNAGDGVAHVRVQVESADKTDAGRFGEMIEVLFSLGALGKVNDEGVPDALWLAAFAHEYRDVLRFTKPPAAVQSVLFPPLAALARATGRRPGDPELHGPTAPCVIDDPGPEGRVEILARPVAAREARGHGG